MPPTNSAAWLTAKCARPLEVKLAPYTPPGPTEIIVKNGAVAINPVEWGKQLVGNLILPFIKYPFIQGGDLAGEVIEVGSAVKKFRIGDRVLALSAGTLPQVNKSSEGAFQLYTVVREHLAAKIPAALSYEQACALPLCMSTAAYGMFHKDFLSLSPPTVPPRPNGKTIIITAGASSVGSNAIQLAISAGYEVYTTASPKDFEYVRRLGASLVFDYRSETFIQDLIAALQGKTVAGAVAIGNGSTEACTKILSRCDGNKFIAQAGPPWPETLPTTILGSAMMVASVLRWMVSTTVKSKITGVTKKFIDCNDLYLVNNEVSQFVYGEFIERALEVGQYVSAPEAQVVGRGLEFIQEAYDVQAKGVPAKKIVVTL